MPIEINEIAIQMRVSDGPGAAAASGHEPAAGSDRLSPAEREAVVVDCVTRVLRALKAERER